MNRGGGGYRGGGRGGRYSGYGWRPARYVQRYVVRHNPVAGHSDDTSSAHEIGSSEIGRRNSEIPLVDDVTKKFSGMSATANPHGHNPEPHGVGNISPNVGNSGLVQNVPEAENQTPKPFELPSVVGSDYNTDSPLSSTHSELNARTTQMIGTRNSEIALVDDVTKKFSGMSATDNPHGHNPEPHGVGTISPNVGNSRLVQNVPEAEDQTPKPFELPSVVGSGYNTDSPLSSTLSELNARTTQSMIGTRNSEIALVDDVTKKFSGMSATDNPHGHNPEPHGIGNISPNVGNSRLVQNVPEAEDQTPKSFELPSVVGSGHNTDSPLSSTHSELTARTTQMIGTRNSERALVDDVTKKFSGMSATDNPHGHNPEPHGVGTISPNVGNSRLVQNVPEAEGQTPKPFELPSVVGSACAMNRGRGGYRGGGRGGRYSGYRGRPARSVQRYAVRHNPVGGHSDDTSSAHETGSSKIGRRNSEMPLVDDVTKKFSGMSATDNPRWHNPEPHGVGNISPNVGNSGLVQNVPEAEDQTPKPFELPSVVGSDYNTDFPLSSTHSELNARTTQMIGTRNSEIALVDDITKKFSGMLATDNPHGHYPEPHGVGNISPNVGNSRLVQNVPEAEDQTPKPFELPSVVGSGHNTDSPSSSTHSELNVRTTQMIHSHHNLSYVNCNPLLDVTQKKKEPFHSVGSEFQDGKLPHEVQNWTSASEGTSRKDEHENSDFLQKGFSFDICEERNSKVIKLKSSLLDKNRAIRNETKRRMQGTNIQIFRPGMILLKGHLPLMDQAKLITACRQLGQGTGGFYQPGYRDGATLHLKMMCLGKNWDPETSRYGDVRPIDEAKPPPIPDEFQQLVKEALQECHGYLDIHSKERNARNVLPSMSPNICIINFYTKTGRLGLHQDKDESKESLRKGLPVVSFSLGDSAKFLYGEERDIDKAMELVLESGDVLIFGGESRHIFHGVSTILPETAPKPLLEETGLRPGRLNLTFREY